MTCNRIIWGGGVTHRIWPNSPPLIMGKNPSPLPLPWLPLPILLPLRNWNDAWSLKPCRQKYIENDKDPRCILFQITKFSTPGAILGIHALFENILDFQESVSKFRNFPTHIALILNFRVFFWVVCDFEETISFSNHTWIKAYISKSQQKYVLTEGCQNHMIRFGHTEEKNKQKKIFLILCYATSRLLSQGNFH